MIKSAMVALACPLGNHKVSFRLVDEHGSGRPFAGLPYRLHDSRGQTLTGNLDSDGFAQIVNLHCGPQVLDLSEITSQYIDPWYEELSIRKNFSLPLTALQIAVEQSPLAPSCRWQNLYGGSSCATRGRAVPSRGGQRFRRSHGPPAGARSRLGTSSNRPAQVQRGHCTMPPRDRSGTGYLPLARSQRFAHTARCSRDKSFVP